MSVSRRTFLSGGIGLALSRGILPAWDDFLSCLRDTSEYIQPRQGETFNGEILDELEKNLGCGIPLLHDRGVFLTFDDGPLRCTGQILDLLAESGHKVTFFVIGRNLAQRGLRSFAVRALREGHDIGNHSYTHPDFSYISARRAEQEIRFAHAAIREVIAEAGVDPARQDLFFRFPYGAPGNRLNRRAIKAVLDELGYGTAWWDIDSHDWRMELQWYPRSPSSVIASLAKARPRDVVLLHDRDKTAQYLPAMLKTIRRLELLSIPLSDIEFGSAVPEPPDTSSGETEEQGLDEGELVRDLLGTISRK